MIEAAEEIKVTMVPTTPITTLHYFTNDKIRTSFLKFLEQDKKIPLTIAEVGVYEGVNSVYMVYMMCCDKLDITLHAIDDYKNIVTHTGGDLQPQGFMDMLKDVAVHNLSRFGERVRFVFKNSIEAAKDYSDETFDYVYIDGDHEYESVRDDLNVWYPKVKSGGILGGHDVNMKEVAKALDEFIHLKAIPESAYGRDPVGNGRNDFWIYK